MSRALHEIGETRLRAAAHDPGCLTRRVEEQRRDALWARHAHLAQFAPRVLAALDLKAAAGDEPLLDAIRYVEGNCQRQLLPDAPLGVLSPTYRTWVVDEHGRTVRTRYELALWLTARDALRARRLYRAGSHRYGDPAAWMMPPAQWQAERVELAAVFDRPLDGLERLEQLPSRPPTARLRPRVPNFSGAQQLRPRSISDLSLGSTRLSSLNDFFLAEALITEVAAIFARPVEKTVPAVKQDPGYERDLPTPHPSTREPSG